MGIDGKLHF